MEGGCGMVDTGAEEQDLDIHSLFEGQITVFLAYFNHWHCLGGCVLPCGKTCLTSGKNQLYLKRKVYF